MSSNYIQDREFLFHLFNSIHQASTPDFNAEDWIKLYDQANQGDLTSAELLSTLWKRKVHPLLRNNPEWEAFVSEEGN